MYYIV